MLSLHSLSDINKVSIRLATADDLALHKSGDLPMYSYSALTDTGTCPVYGGVTYGRRVTPTLTDTRDQALELGSAAHDCFQAMRLWQLWKIQNLPDHAMYHGERVFGDVRWNEIARASKSPDLYTSGANMLVTTLGSSGFTNDGVDRRRTVENAEESLIKYFTEYDYERFHVWVRDEKNPESAIGAELPCIVHIKFDNVFECLIVALIDGVHVDQMENNTLVINENKTTSRLTESWATSFFTSHQIRMYGLLASMLLDYQFTRCDVYGLTVPLPKTGGMGGFHREPIDDLSYRDLYEWILHNGQLLEHARIDPLSAPQYTHSCNRFFKTCSLLSMCSSPIDERNDLLEAMYPRDETHVLSTVDMYSRDVLQRALR